MNCAAGDDIAFELPVVATARLAWDGTYRAQLSAAAAKQRIPAIYANRTYLRAGGLMSYGPDLERAFRRAAYFVDRILKGARSSDLPIEQATTFQLVINQRAAKAIDFKLPQALVLRADEVLN